MILTYDKNEIQPRLTEYIDKLAPGRDRSGKWCCPVCGSGSGANGTSAFSVTTKNGCPVWSCLSSNHPALPWKSGKSAAGGDIFDLYAQVNGLHGLTDFAIIKNGLGKTLNLTQVPFAEYVSAIDQPAPVDCAIFSKEEDAVGEQMSFDDFQRFCNYITHVRPIEEADKDGFAVGAPHSERRKEEFILPRNWIGLDADDITEEQFDALHATLEDMGVKAFIYPTARDYKVNGLRRVRILMSLDQPVDKDTYRQVVHGLCNLLPVPIDPASERPTQMMYTPTGVAQERCEYLDGLPIKVGAFKTVLSMLDRIGDLFADSKDVQMIPTGFDRLDNALGGGLEQGLHVFGAGSSMGKSSFALQLALNVARQKKPVMFFSWEMSYLEHVRRVLVVLSSGVENFTNDQIKWMLKTKDARINPVLERFKEVAPYLYFFDTYYSKATPDGQIEQLIDAVDSSRFDNPLVIVDYLQYTNTADEKANEDAIKRNRKVAIGLRNLALGKGFDNRQLSVKPTVFALSSVNRDNYYQIPRLDAFKETGEIEYTANTALLMYFTDFQEGTTDSIKGKNKAIIEEQKQSPTRNLTIKVEKSRDGKTGARIDFVFTGERYTFKELKPNEYKWQQTAPTVKRI